MNYVNFNRQEGLAFTTSVDANPNTVYFTSDTHEIIINGQSYGPDLLPLWNKVSEVEIVTSAALNHLNDVKQGKVDNGLETDSKFVVGAINELNARFNEIGQGGTIEGAYLPLAGGTMSGDITMSGESRLIFGDTPIYYNSDLFIDGPLQVDGNITALGFIHATNDSDDYVLLAGGGTKLLSEISSDMSGYLPLTGGTMSGDTKFNGASIYFDNDCAALKINDAGAFEIYSGNGITLSGFVECSDSITCASNISAAAFYEISDARKKDIKEDLSLDKCYDLIDKCQTVIYSLKDQTKEQVGMIAQEIEEFFPEVVATDEEGFKSLAYDRLVVICFKVLKDIIKRLNHIESIL